jgi:hypothetical protein
MPGWRVQNASALFSWILYLAVLRQRTTPGGNFGGADIKTARKWFSSGTLKRTLKKVNATHTAVIH